jgi:3-hydroxyacyl-[acyl-carrier-protein] dehydratase
MKLELPLDTVKIKEIIPHRYPFLLIDRVTEFNDGHNIVGLKNVSCNESFFEGHFPERPLMPGVLILEALAQLGVLYSRVRSDGVEGKRLSVFAGVDKVRFRRPVSPGDQLKLEMIEVKRRSNLWVMEGIASVDGEEAASGLLRAAEIP